MSSRAAAYSALCLGSEQDAVDYAARAAPTTRSLDNPYAQMINSGNAGLAALLTGESDTASRAFREELALCRKMVVRPVLFEGLRGLAAVATVQGDDARAATLVGAAGAHRYDVPEDPVEPRLDRAFFAPPAPGTGPPRGTPPRTRIARCPSTRRSPTPSKSRPGS